jgi:hypothetical protein
MRCEDRKEEEGQLLYLDGMGVIDLHFHILTLFHLFNAVPARNRSTAVAMLLNEIL